MKKIDILVIGGGPAGVVAAIAAKEKYPSKIVALVREQNKSVIPCGIPYIFDRLSSVEDDIMPDTSLDDNNIDIIISKISKIEPNDNIVITEEGKRLAYDKLILAIGSSPQALPISGKDKKGVWLVKKDLDHLKSFRKNVLESENVVIVGGGFIGVEFADELSRIDGLKVSVVEMQEHCLAVNFDTKLAEVAEKRIKDKGVDIYSKSKVKEIGGESKVEYVELDSGDRIKADLVIMAIGACPNTELAEMAGIEVVDGKGIIVDKKMKTNFKDIFAIGDCACTKELITGNDIPLMLASVATTEARIAAFNLYEDNEKMINQGTLGVFSTCVNGLTLGAVGLTEQRAKKEGIDHVIGQAQAPDHHPGKLPGMNVMTVKLIFSKDKGELIGGEMFGSESVGEAINILAVAVQKKLKISEIYSLQMATHPLLTSAPTVYPIILAAKDVFLKTH